MKYKVKDLPGISNVDKIFFVGIKGVGVAPLAMITASYGVEIAGSDIDEEFITDKYLKKLNIKIYKGFIKSDIEEFFGVSDFQKCLVVTTGAHKGYDNPQVNWAKGKSINVLTQGQALAILMNGQIVERNFKSIAVAGSHGKTTISSLLANTLKALGHDPTYSVGTGEAFPLGAPGDYGSGEYFVAEADEYASEPIYDRIPKFLYQTPNYAIFNNIDFDHPDLFKSIDEIVDAFLQFSSCIKSGGKLLVNGDDKYLKSFKEKVDKDISVVTYGEGKDNDYRISQIVVLGLNSRFNVTRNGKELGHFELSIPGLHNAKNSLSVIALLTELGFDADKIRICLKEFKGTKRRLEVVGRAKSGAIIIDDYAHHPLEIETTIESIQKAYPDKKLVCIFQPHTFSRTKTLLTDFGKSFKKSFSLILLPVFSSARDNEKDTLSVDEFTGVFKEYVNTKFLENFEDVVKYVGENYKTTDYIIVTFGAGDVYKIAYELKYD